RNGQRSSQRGWTGHEGGSMPRAGDRPTPAQAQEAKRRTLVAWLNDAYAMEKSLVQTLRGHANDAKNHPVIAQRLRDHAEESKHRARLVQDCIERLGGSVSNIKSSLSSVMGAVSG